MAVGTRLAEREADKERDDREDTQAFHGAESFTERKKNQERHCRDTVNHRQNTMAM